MATDYTQDIRDLIAANISAPVADGSRFTGDGQAVIVRPDLGSPNRPLVNGGASTMFKPSVRVRVRGDMNGQIAGRRLALEIRDIVHQSAETLGAPYAMVLLETDVQPVPTDNDARPMWDITFRVWIEE